MYLPASEDPKTFSLLHKWEWWLEGIPARQPIGGSSDSYHLAAGFLKDCKVVEDWGGGLGYLKELLPEGVEYRNVDGSHNEFVDIEADLTSYMSPGGVDGICIRHVIEHNPQWRQLLDHAYVSTKRKLCLILFTPLVKETHQMSWHEQVGVPDIAFKTADLLPQVGQWDIHWTQIKSQTQYGVETIFYMWRADD